jgi:hypothetical protein
MVIGDFLGYSSLGLGSPLTRNHNNSERSAVTLDARLDPKKPNEYAVQSPSPVIAPPEKSSDVKNAGKRATQNTDPASRAFNAVADYEAPKHRIDIRV